jgi:hypothetical protein
MRTYTKIDYPAKFTNKCKDGKSQRIFSPFFVLFHIPSVWCILLRWTSPLTIILHFTQWQCFTTILMATSTGACRLTVVQNKSDVTTEVRLVNGYIQTQLEDTSYALISLYLTFYIKSRIMKYRYTVSANTDLYHSDGCSHGVLNQPTKYVPLYNWSNKF